MIAVLLAVLLAQAEPAPPDYVPPGAPGPGTPAQPALPPAGTSPYVPPREPPPKWHLAVAPHLAVLLDEGQSGLPRIGYGAGAQLSRALWNLGRSLRFGFGFDFAYDRFYRDKPAAQGGGQQFLSHATFAVIGVFDGLFGRLRPWLAIGGGLSVAAYEDPPSSPTVKGISEVGVAGLVKVAAGFGVRVYESFELGLRADVNVTLSPAQVGTPPRNVFQPGLFALGLDLGFRF